jgi:hypothetical protein
MADREYHEGPEAARRFADALGRVLKVSKSELLKREAAWKRARQRQKRRRAKTA